MRTASRAACGAARGGRERADPEVEPSAKCQEQ